MFTKRLGDGEKKKKEKLGRKLTEGEEEKPEPQ